VDGKANLLGAKLKELRLEAGMTQAQVVEKLQKRKPQAWDCDTIVYSTIELQKRSLSDIETAAILEVLGRTWADLQT
jgi:transcriptional regulator with XRE-family HTH domain